MRKSRAAVKRCSGVRKGERRDGLNQKNQTGDIVFSKELMGRLNFIKGDPLTLIEAPSGFGKTTALRHFLDSEVSGNARILWLTLTEKKPETG